MASTVMSMPAARQRAATPGKCESTVCASTCEMSSSTCVWPCLAIWSLMARATTSRGASSSRSSYWCMKRSPCRLYSRPPSPRTASVIRNVRGPAPLAAAPPSSAPGDLSARAVRHGHSIAGGDAGVGGDGVELAKAAAREHGGEAEEAAERRAAHVHHVHADHGRLAVRLLLQHQVCGQVVFEERDGRVGARRRQQGTLNLCTAHVSGVHDAALAVAALHGQVKAAVRVARELGTHGSQLQHAGRALAAHHLDRREVIEVGTCHHGVANMRGNGVGLVQDGAHTALRVLRTAFRCSLLGDDGHGAVSGHLEGVREAGDARAYDQVIKLADVTRGLSLGNRTGAALTRALRPRPKRAVGTGIGAASCTAQAAWRRLGRRGARGAAAADGGRCAGRCGNRCRLFEPTARWLGGGAGRRDRPAKERRRKAARPSGCQACRAAGGVHAARDGSSCHCRGRRAAASNA
eukprot:365930-Chlamydomonas_euryale.AAC.10